MQKCTITHRSAHTHTHTTHARTHTPHTHTHIHTHAHTHHTHTHTTHTHTHTHSSSVPTGASLGCQRLRPTVQLTETVLLRQYLSNQSHLIIIDMHLNHVAFFSFNRWYIC